MCGFFCLFNCTDELIERSQQLALKYLKQRGEDQFNQIRFESGVIYHSRFTVTGDSKHGIQPCVKKDGSLMLVFNGEIYNWKELTHQREFFKSDTDFLFSRMESWDSNPAGLRGMGSWVLVDPKFGGLQISRMGTGEKPLYYYLSPEQGCIAVSSDPRIIGLLFDLQLNCESEQFFLTLGFLPDSLSIFDSVKKVTAGTSLCFQQRKSRKFEFVKEVMLDDSDAILSLNNLPQPTSLQSSVQSKTISGGTGDAAIERLKQTLCEALDLMYSKDVPSCLFLSGGVDSSLIWLLFRYEFGFEIPALTAKIQDYPENESSLVSEFVSRHGGGVFDQIDISIGELATEFYRCSELYSEPFADSSALVTSSMMKAASENGFRIVLGGDGADEYFGGYRRYFTSLPALAEFFGKTNISYVIQKFSASVWSRDVNKILKVLCSGSSEAAYLTMMKAIQESTVNEQFVEQFPNVFYGHDLKKGSGCFALSKMDREIYLKGDTQVKVDRISYANGIEYRSPFLDKNVRQLAFDEIINSENRELFRKKKFLRLLGQKYDKTHFQARKKQGFSVPLSQVVQKLGDDRPELQGLQYAQIVFREWQKSLYS